jgi:predicted metalloprotease with PDZ domain
MASDTLVVAVLFAAATVFYSAIWMYYIRQDPRTTVHITALPSRESSGVITAVDRGSPAAKSGVQPGDRIVSVNGKNVHSFEPFVTAVTRARAGDHVSLGIRKPGSTQIRYLDLEAEDIPPMSMPLGAVSPYNW